MKVIVDFTLIPIGTSLSLSPYVALCQDVLQQSPVRFELHANGTNIEGDWDDVMAAVKKCHHAVHKKGAQRISSFLHVGTRTDKDQSMAQKIDSVQAKRTAL